jgi:hypothetical protein
LQTLLYAEKDKLTYEDGWTSTKQHTARA